MELAHIKYAHHHRTRLVIPGVSCAVGLLLCYLFGISIHLLQNHLQHPLVVCAIGGYIQQ